MVSSTTSPIATPAPSEVGEPALLAALNELRIEDHKATTGEVPTDERPIEDQTALAVPSARLPARSAPKRTQKEKWQSASQSAGSAKNKHSSTSPERAGFPSPQHGKSFSPGSTPALAAKRSGAGPDVRQSGATPVSRPTPPIRRPPKPSAIVPSESPTAPSSDWRSHTMSPHSPRNVRRVKNVDDDAPSWPSLQGHQPLPAMAPHPPLPAKAPSAPPAESKLKGAWASRSKR